MQFDWYCCTMRSVPVFNRTRIIMQFRVMLDKILVESTLRKSLRNTVMHCDNAGCTFRYKYRQKMAKSIEDGKSASTNFLHLHLFSFNKLLIKLLSWNATSLSFAYHYKTDVNSKVCNIPTQDQTASECEGSSFQNNYRSHQPKHTKHQHSVCRQYCTGAFSIPELYATL